MSNSNNPHQGLHNLYLFLGIIVACIVIRQFIAPKLPLSITPPATPVHQGQLVGHIVQGPATIEAYNPSSCGTFQITSGQTYDPSTDGDTAGYYWEYASDSDNNAKWPQHETDFFGKSFNGQHCHLGRP